MLKRLRKGQRGFTLVELLVTIAILGTLFGIVTLALNTLASSSDPAMRAAEHNQVQTAADIYLAANWPTVTTITAQAASGAATSGADFGAYMRGAPSVYCYTWTAAGDVTQQAGTTVAGGC